MFVNRIDELNYLEKLHKEQDARFVIMYGRIYKTNPLVHGKLY